MPLVDRRPSGGRCPLSSGLTSDKDVDVALA